MQPGSKSIEALLQSARLSLAADGIEEVDLEARLLLQHVTCLTRSQLVLHAGEPLEASVVARFFELVKRRGQRIPLQHLTGVQEFWSLELIVSPAVLIPRPETEFLLEQVLTKITRRPDLRLLDMCTGSGAIALALARELACQVVAVDLSAEALAVATLNRQKYELENQVELIRSDLFAALKPGAIYDCIVSNPPYIADAEIDILEPEVALAEPRMALSGGEDGLGFIRSLIQLAPSYLRPGGWLFMEIGADQKTAVEKLFDAHDSVYEQVRVVTDYAGRPRVAMACLATRDNTADSQCLKNNSTHS